MRCDKLLGGWGLMSEIVRLEKMLLGQSGFYTERICIRRCIHIGEWVEVLRLGKTFARCDEFHTMVFCLQVHAY